MGRDIVIRMRKGKVIVFINSISKQLETWRFEKVSTINTITQESLAFLHGTLVILIHKQWFIEVQS
jgi:hypothetical protein